MIRQDYRRFLILSSPRCGSHMLRTSFHGHRAVIARTELFNPDWNRNEPFDDSMAASRVLGEHVWGGYPSHVQAVGFILHRSGARLGNWPDLWPLLEADKAMSVLSLRRENLLLRYLSFHLMRERARSGLGRAFVPVQRVLHVDDLQAEFERAERELAAFDARFSGHALMPLSYEQILGDYRASMNRVQLFLGVDPNPLSPRTRRNLSPKPWDLILNFDELALAFADTRWGWYFNQDGECASAMRASAEVSIDL